MRDGLVSSARPLAANFFLAAVRMFMGRRVAGNSIARARHLAEITVKRKNSLNVDIRRIGSQRTANGRNKTPGFALLMGQR